MRARFRPQGEAAILFFEDEYPAFLPARYGLSRQGEAALGRPMTRPSVALRNKELVEMGFPCINQACTGKLGSPEEKSLFSFAPREAIGSGRAVSSLRKCLSPY